MTIDTAELEERTRLETDYDATVRQDIEQFRLQAEDWVAGRISDDAFRAHRLRRGIYGQRQAGVQMIRTKIPGGQFTADQARQLARVADEYAGGKAHLTTRQNVQYHFVPLADVPPVLHLLADARLTTREACYNTVRNVVACPLAGLHPDELFDPLPHMRQVAFAFLHQKLTDALPRKFKIAFCGCPDDCVITSINDVGLRPVIRHEDGVERRGFRMVVGGGLGPLPCEAKLLDEFVPVERLVNRIEAIIRVFDKHGNRKNKNMARLKFAIRERGFEWLREQIEREYEDILTDGGIEPPVLVPEGFGGFRSVPPPAGDGHALPVLSGNGHHDAEYDRWLETNVHQQKQRGYAVVTVRVDQGNLTGDQLRGLARIAESAGEGLLRVTTDQNLKLAFVPLHAVKRVYGALRQLGLEKAGAQGIEDVVTCPGAYSCNLALTKSMNLGAALAGLLAGRREPEIRGLSVKVSGCPNACGQHWTADFGFYGNARKIEGVEVPYYQMLLGGGVDEGGLLRFGLAVQSMPAKLTTVAVTRVLDHFRASRLEGETFRAYVLRHKVEMFREMLGDLARPVSLDDEVIKDWGDEVGFSLKLGRGECAS